MKIAVVFWLVLSTFTMEAQEKITVFFDFAKTIPNPQSVVSLQNWIKQNPQAEILKIQGYCDTVHTPTFNLKLAQQRIESVEAILLKNNLTIAKNVEKKAFGETFDWSINQNENRKVTLFYTIPAPEPSFKKELEAAQIGDKLKLQGLNFFGGKDIVLPRSEAVMEELLEMMIAIPTLKVEIQGHICCSTEEDAELSTRRAQTVYNFLLSKGIHEDRLSYKGFSSTQPIYPLPEKSFEEREANRRVEILIVAK